MNLRIAARAAAHRRRSAPCAHAILSARLKVSLCTLPVGLWGGSGRNSKAAGTL